MNAPIIVPCWQAFAKTAAVVSSTFAMIQMPRHCCDVGQRQHSLGPRSDDPSLTPSLRSGPSKAGPTFRQPALGAGRKGADCADRAKICFEIRDIAVESVAITTNQRGSLSCANRLSFSPFFPCRWPAACRTPRRAGLPVPLQARLSPTHSMKTSSRVQRLVALPVLQPAGSKSACRPATRATDPLAYLAAFGRTTPPIRTIRASRPGGPLHFACFEGGL